MIEYAIKPVNPNAHIYRIRLKISQPDPEGQRLSLPNWIPGSYMIRDFSKHLSRLEASCAGKAVGVSKLDKSNWRCAPCEGLLEVSYEVYAWDLSVRGAHLDQHHGFFNGTSVFVAVTGQEEEACRVMIERPDGDAFRDWNVATALPRAAITGQWQFGEYRAGNYDELIDHPVEMGTFSRASFDACGVPHHLVLTGRHNADLERICADLKRICEYHIRFFGEPAPMDEYYFLVQVLDTGFGGLEHRASTALHSARKTLPARSRVRDEAMARVGKDYRQFLALCSHEYFHTWNIKRIKPAKFMPYDLRQESHTRTLWAFEGITSYYDDLALVRTGLITQSAYLELLAQNLTRILRTPGRLQQTVTESSFDAWTKFYKQDENAPNSIISYYGKGAAIALALDLELRQRSAGKLTLDQVMKKLWQDFGQKGIGVGEQEIEAICEQLLGEPLAEFFHRALDSTEELPMTDLLETVGLKLEFRASKSAQDLGGVKTGQLAAETQAQELRPVDLGVVADTNGETVKLRHVYRDSAGQQAGLSAGDHIIAIDGLKVTAADWENRLRSYEPGDRVRIHGFRRDQLLELTVTLARSPQDTCELSVMDNTELENNREHWLKG